MGEDLRVGVGGEVAVLPPGRRVGPDHPVDELLQAPLALRRAHRAAEVLGGDDVGGVDRPEVGELHALLLEVDRSVTPVGHDDVAALPGDLVIGMNALAGVDAADGESLACSQPALRCPPAPARRRPASRRLGHRFPLQGSVSSRREPGLAPWSCCCCVATSDAPRGPAHRAAARCSVLPARWLGVARALPGVVPARPGVVRARRLVAFRTQRGNLVLEIRERLESPVDRGESQVGDLVEVTQRPQDGQAHLMRGDLPAAAAPDRVLDPLGQDRELVLADRPALAGPPDAADDLVPVERLGDAAALGHHEDDRLLGGEPPAARRARPPTADRRAVLGGPAVDDPAVGMLAIRTVHATHLPSGSSLLATLTPPVENYSGVTTRYCGRSGRRMQVFRGAAPKLLAGPRPPAGPARRRDAVWRLSAGVSRRRADAAIRPGTQVAACTAVVGRGTGRRHGVRISSGAPRAAAPRRPGRRSGR